MPDIPPQDRLILALDVPSPEEARAIVEELGPAVAFYKLGLELFMAGGYFELIEWLTAQGKKVMVDLKFFDVPRTVGAAVARLAEREVTFATVHGNDAMLEAAARAKGKVKILGVTVLTSLDQGDLDDLGFTVDVEKLVLSRARRALERGCDGVVCSGHELLALRRELPGRLLCVVPGIRPVANREEDDQKRTVDVAEALRRGADHLVIGRPILGAPDRRAAALAIQQQIRTHATG
ncbi:MAG TPA: orotidine-5'-phosphate decarboxylase [Thermoanaerobaculia bacterium]|nr:orotidine-5'-phosphate decarboxylase [Thermoanaerobaculia bacterium]